MKEAIRKPLNYIQESYLVREALDSHFYPNWHFHPEIELFYVLKGSGTRFVGDSIEPFNDGDMVLIGTNMPHLWRSDSSYFEKNSLLRTHSIVVYFNKDFLGDMFFEKSETKHLSYLLGLASQRGLKIGTQLQPVISQKLKHLAKFTPGLEGIILILEILSTIAKEQDFKLLANSGYINNTKPAQQSRMQKIHDYVLNNFHKSIDLKTVANLNGMAPTAFSRYFKNTTNKTFTQFIIEVRIGHACKLLMDGNMSIAHIAYECGFDTISNFNFQFKKVVSLKPTEYKVKNKLKDSP